MTYSVGQAVVYPNHGAAVVEDIEVRTVKGEDQIYLVLRITAQRGLVVRVPARNLELLGVREVIDEDELQQMLEVLHADATEEHANWSRRHRANTDKLRSGSAIGVAEVVRDLVRRRREGNLSAAEGHTLTKAYKILTSELAHCGQPIPDEAQRLLDEALVG